MSLVFVLAVAGLVRAQEAPNIILFYADDLGYGELGCYGQEKIRTPSIDRLAAEGMRFTRYYSASTVCAPSRAALMTGKHTGHAYIRGNKEVGGWGPEEPEGQWPLADGEVTLAELLKSRGYVTCAVGKWGLGGPGSEGHPNRQGFDHFYGYLCQRVAHNYYPTHLWRNHDVDVLGGNDYFRAHQRLEQAPTDEAVYEQYRGGDYAPQEILEEADGWLRKQAESERPFFLYYASIIPHAALQAPAEFVDAYPREWDPEPYLGNRGYLPNPRPHATYAAMISFLDHSVGRILDTLDELGLADNTIVLFTSDNGTTFNGGVDREFFNSLGELRGFKTNLYDGGIRMPCVARWPGEIPAGAVTDHLWYAPDIMPTLLAMIGGAAPEGIDGLDMSAALRGEPDAPEHEYLYWEFPEGRQQQAVLFDGRYKAIRPDLKQGLTVELYDLIEDPGETQDLAEKQPELVARAQRIMREARTPSALFPIPALDGG
ncbi:MAG: arylsulfatase [Phycisphaerales bacterium JB039]